MSCNDLISNIDIESIYDNVTSHLLTASMHSHCIDSDTKKANISIQLNGDDLTTNLTKREYFRDRPLINHLGSSGKVVEHITFVIKDEYRDDGIAKSIHVEELKIYERNEFQQIQLTAVGQGILVWYHLYYKFVEDDGEEDVLIQLWSYLKQVHSLDRDTIEKKFKNKNLKDIPNKYLQAPSTGAIDFAEWLSRNDCIGIEMYKDIA